MKKILTILFLCVGYISFSQGIIQRSSPSVTAADARVFFQLNAFIPRYNDTSQANIANNIGIDSCGAIIFTYDVNDLWTRACSPKRWIRQVSSQDTTLLGGYWTLTGNNLYPTQYATWNVGIGTNAPTTPFNITVKTRFDVPDASTTLFNKIGNVTDIAGADNINSFILYNNINSPSTPQLYGAALKGQVTLRIHNTQDTLYTSSVNDGSTGLLISSFRNGATNDTSAKVTTPFGYGSASYYTHSRNTFVSDFHAGSTDSVLQTDTITKWRINLPTGSIFTKVTIPDRGALQEFSDLTIGYTGFNDSTSSNSSFHVKRHNGINILPIDNTNTDTSYAIYQQGATDSIYFHTTHIRTDNIPAGAPSTFIGTDANGNWVTATSTSLIPTWQQTLDVSTGSTLTHDNSIDMGDFNFNLSGTGKALFLDSLTGYLQTISHGDLKTFSNYFINSNPLFDRVDEGAGGAMYMQIDSNSAPMIQEAIALDSLGMHVGFIVNSESPTAIIPFETRARTKLVYLNLVDNTTGNVLSLDANHGIISIPQSGFGSTNIFDSTLIGQASTPMTYNGTTDWGNTSWTWSNMLNFSATVANISTIGDVNASLSNDAGSGTITQIAANSITNDADTLYLKVDNYGGATNGYVLSIADITTGRTAWIPGSTGGGTFDASLIAQGSTPMTYNSATDWNNTTWQWGNVGSFQISTTNYDPYFYIGDGVLYLGDSDPSVNGTVIKVDDPDKAIILNTPTDGKLFLNVSNAAAATNGDVPYLIDNTTGEIGWKTVGGASWLLTGNSGTTPGTNFIGTTDAERLIFKVNNERSGLIDYNGDSGTVSLGYQNLISNTTGDQNVAVGYQALFSNTEGFHNVAIGFVNTYSNTTGNDNTAIGWEALLVNDAGSGNMALGSNSLANNTSGNNNIGIGFYSLINSESDNYNIGIGDSTSVTVGHTSSIALGHTATADSSFQFALADTIKYWKFRGKNYTLPSTQTNGVLTNTGGVLTWAAVSGFANTALSNLASVAINTSLLPGTDNSIDLGNSSSPKRWRNIYSTYDLIGSISSNYLELTPPNIYVGDGFGTITNINLTRIANNSSAFNIGQMDVPLSNYNTQTQYTSTIISSLIAATEVMRVNSTGLAVGTTSNTTAWLKLGAGTTSKAPVILTSGTNLTSALSGALEYDGTNYYVTNSTPTRQTLPTIVSPTAVGQTTLVSGTKAVTITGVSTSSKAIVTLVTPSGVTLTTTYQAVCTANTLTIQANVAAGTINTADGSTLNYIVFN